MFLDSIEVILNYNTNLLQDLKPRINKWQPWSVLGDIFLEFVSYYGDANDNFIVRLHESVYSICKRFSQCTSLT